MAAAFADPDRDRPAGTARDPGHRRGGAARRPARRPAPRRGAGAGNARWAAFLAPLPERLRDEEPTALRKTAMAARAAYGPRDSIRDALSDELTLPFLAAIDRLLKVLARHRMRAD